MLMAEISVVKLPSDSWMFLDRTDDKSTLVQVMACCHQATSNYLSQCWPRSMSPYGVTRPQWVNTILMACETSFSWDPSGCFTNVSWARQNIRSKFYVAQKSHLMVRISSWNFACVPIAMLWVHALSFSWKFSPYDFWHCIFSRNYFGELTKFY